MRKKLSRDQELLNELDQKSSLLDKTSSSFKAFLESSQCGLSAIESGQLNKTESDKLLDTMKVVLHSKRINDRYPHS